MTILQMARNIANRSRQSFLHLNLYKKHSSTEQTMYEEHLATRIYVCSLAFLMFIITIASTFMIRTVSNVEYSPSKTKFSQLISKYADTLHCPCSTIGIPYYTFVTNYVQFHQVCSSAFLEQTWIDMIFAQYYNSSLSTSKNDFRLTLSFFWQLIKGFCMLSNRTWNDTLTGFSVSHFFSPVVLAEDILQSQVKTILQNQINFAQTKLTYDLLSIRRLTSGNQLVSALATNYYLRYRPDDNNPGHGPVMSPRTFNHCSCLSVEGCPHSATMLDHQGESMIIPGMVDDCLIIDSTLASTLECYYNQTYLSLLHPSIPTYIQPLSNEYNKHFLMNSTIEKLLNELMIDEMINDIEYDFYYSKCNVSYCSYSYKHRYDILFVLTTIIGIFGGLSFILRFLSPYIVILILKWKNRHLPNNLVSSTTITQQNKLHLFFNYVRKTPKYIQECLANLNLFEADTERTLKNIYREQLLTRIFIILLMILSMAAGFYIFLVPQNQIMIVSQPSLDTYHQLYNNYSDTLQCPCTNMSVPYGHFLNVTFVLHQICSSDFVSPEWLYYITRFDPIFIPSWLTKGSFGEFRMIGVSYFQLLATFCSLAKTNIEDAKDLFVNTQFINAHVLAPSFFDQQAQSIIESYISDTRNDFRRTFDWISIAFITNSLLTGANTNFDLTVTNNETLIMNDFMFQGPCEFIQQAYGCGGACACPTESLSCLGIDLLYINQSNFFQFEQIFDELPIGCVPLSGLLKSTFAWWYNETYLKNIQATYAVVINNSQSPPSIKPLNSSISTRFRNNILKDLLKEMFTEVSINHTDFNRFYHGCAPISCSYTIVQRRDILVALLLLISVCGGLNKILHIAIRACGKLIFFFIDWWNTRQIEQPLPSMTARTNHLFHFIYQSIIHLNLYKTGTNDEIIIKREKVQTRLYLILFIGCLSIILLYTAIIERTITEKSSLTTIMDYEHLSKHYYSNNLNCLCTRISIPYNDLILQLRVNQFHEACSTDKIDRALNSGVRFLSGQTFHDQDFRNTKDVFIQGLQQLCTLAQETIDNNIRLFRDSTMFSNQLIAPNQFYNELNVTLNRFKQKISIEFARTLDLIRTNTQGNALVAFSTNWRFVVDEKGKGKNASFHAESVIYFDTVHNTTCICATSQSCTMQPKLFDGHGILLYTFDDLVLGCYPLETILLSSLSCFYSMECIYSFRQELNVDPSFLEMDKNGSGFAKPFNSSLTRFNINDTIETLAYEMFIESWLNDVSYERFYNSCAPMYCTYNLYYRFDALELLTTFLSIYAGLSIVIHFLVPYLILIINKARNRFRIVPLQ